MNDTYVPPDDKCVLYTCEDIDGHLVTKETKTSCPPYNPLDCEPVSSLNIASATVKPVPPPPRCVTLDPSCPAGHRDHRRKRLLQVL